MKKILISMGLAAMLAPAVFADDVPAPEKEFVERQGAVSMEAEQYTSQAGYVRRRRTDASGRAVMQAVGGAGSRLNFRFEVRRAGTWYLWIRTHSTADINNGMYLGLDGRDLTAPSSHPLAGARDVYLPKVGWNWTPQWLRGHSHSGPITMNLRAGRHTLSIIKRKVENPMIDKIVLTRSATPPAGYGPASIAGDLYEPDNYRSRAKFIANGQTQRRSIHKAGNEDWVKIRIGGHGARNLRIETSGTSGDTQMWLYRPGGRLVAYNNNGGRGRFSKISVFSLPAGTYTIRIREYGNNGTIGAYTLRARWSAAPIPADAYEPDNYRSAAKKLYNGPRQWHTIHRAGNADWAKFTIGRRGARNVRIETAGRSGNTQLYLYNRAGRRLRADSNSGVGRFSRITLSSLAAGTYYVKVQEYGNNGRISAYTLKATWTNR